MANYFIKTILTLILIFYSPSIAQTNNIRFEHLTVNDGLSSNTVNCIYQDSQGFMWFGTAGGLSKYDGYNILIFSHDPKDSSSLSDNYVKAIQEDKHGNIWIGTSNGLNKLNPTTGNIEYFFNRMDNPNSLSSNNIMSLYIDKNDTIWIGTDKGLNKLEIFKNHVNSLETYQYKHYQHDEYNQNSLSNNVIIKIYEDRSGVLWIGTRNGLNAFDRTNETFTRYFNDPADPFSISGNHITEIYQDENNNLWIGTGYVRESGVTVYDKSGLLNRYNKNSNKFFRYEKNDDPFYISFVSSIVEDRSRKLWFGAIENHGLYQYDEQSNQFIRYGYYQNNPYSLSSNMVTDLFVDKSGILWIATNQVGINKYDPNKDKFNHFEYLPGIENNLHSNNITGIIEDSFGKVWLGTWGKKTTVFDPVSGLFEKYTYILYFKKPKIDPRHLSWPWVTNVYEDKSKNIWIGTTIGLNKYNRKTKTYKKYFDNPKNPNDPNFISSDYIYSILHDKHGDLWIGTINGLNRMNIKDETFKHYFHNPDDITSISANTIYCIYEDKSGDLWLSSYNGLHKYDRNNDQFIRYQHDKLDKSSLSNNSIWVISEDNSGNIWVGTMGGLNKFDKSTNTFTYFATQDGLPNNHVLGILEDDNKNLWISTANGLSKFDLNNMTFRNYDVDDGLQSNEFNFHSYHKGKSGRFYFGGNNGFNTFYPDSIKDNPYIPPVVITSFNILDKPFPISKPISDIDHIQLSHDQNIISYDFVSLNYTNSHKNRYAYILEGLESEWIHCGERRFARYSNIPPGDYTFRVKGSNNDRIWNEEGASIKIIITPPWWKTNLAYVSYFILFGLIIYLIWHFQMKRIRLKHDMEMEHMQSEKYQEIDRLKSHFFANISHEFRTPLTLILSPIEQLLSDTFIGNIKEGYVTIRSNAKKLLRLVNQLLSLSKLEAGQIKLYVSEKDIVSIFKRIVNLFSSLAQRKNIDLKYAFPKSLIIYFDEEKIDIILTNLLSNAFKFTPEGGEIEVAVGKNNELLTLGTTATDFVKITISNTGSYIPENQLDKIFDRFYQVESNNHVEGTGIGLSLTKDLVELHHGKITVKSKVGKKTTFTILIPTLKENYKSEEIVEYKVDDRKIEEVYHEIKPPEIEIDVDKTAIQELPKVLIVEDNEEVRKYLRKNLEEKYNIFVASNGKIGFEQAEKQLPNLIISDVMMPEMDGFEFCDKIKSEIATNHIPVILLTARATREDRLEGLKTGADEYLPKPFDLEELFIRIENLIKQRRGLKEQFLKEELFGIDKITSHPAEQEFVEKITQVINQNINNGDYTVNDFAHDIGLSRAQLFRKLKVWTNQTPNDFIRLYRLKKAAILLKNKSHNVIEAAFAVGFKDASYFTRSFKKQFGKTPKEFVNS